MATSGPTAIMVIRHAEKPGTYNGQTYYGVDAAGTTCGNDGAESLVTIGWERAGALVTLFAPPYRTKTLNLPQPQYIYASDPDSEKDKEPSQRPDQTVTAVAATLGLTIDTSFKKDDHDDMVKAALQQNGVVLICWQHEDIPAIGQEILQHTHTSGITVPTTWPVGPNGARYDLIWMFSRPSGDGPIATFSQIAQMLLPGDTAVS